MAGRRWQVVWRTERERNKRNGQVWCFGSLSPKLKVGAIMGLMKASKKRSVIVAAFGSLKFKSKSDHIRNSHLFSAFPLKLRILWDKFLRTSSEWRKESKVNIRLLYCLTIWHIFSSAVGPRDNPMISRKQFYSSVNTSLPSGIQKWPLK